ncbi:MAG: DUF2312 domain-containing protein [Alphaproteobacteria bacterium]
MSKSRKSNAGNGPGHNSGDLGGTSKDILKSYIDRVERLDGEKAALAADIREVYAEAKKAGLNTRAMRQIVRERRAEPDIQAEHLAAMEQMRRDLGMYAETPLGQAAVKGAVQAAA